jgi:hypothetical protein
MYFKLTQLEFGKRTMESGDHSKNGASPKSLMSRGNFFKVMCVLVLFTFVACKTTTTLSSKVSLGMTKKEVIQKCGKPYKQTAKYDTEKNLQEILFYKEKTWDDAGWSWSTTVANHMLVFKNGVLIAIEQGDEEHNKQRYNTHFVW